MSRIIQVYKTIISIIALIIVFEFTIGKTLNKITNTPIITIESILIAVFLNKICELLEISLWSDILIDITILNNITIFGWYSK